MFGSCLKRGHDMYGIVDYVRQWVEECSGRFDVYNYYSYGQLSRDTTQALYTMRLMLTS